MGHINDYLIIDTREQYLLYRLYRHYIRGLKMTHEATVLFISLAAGIAMIAGIVFAIVDDIRGC